MYKLNSNNIKQSILITDVLIATIRYAIWPSHMALSVETNYSCQYSVYFTVL